MDIITTLLVVLVLTLLLILWKKTSRDARYPPGPPTLPFLGNLNMNTTDMIGEFRRFRQRYGDVFSLILGTKTVVVVSGYDTLKELFVKHADVVSERPDAFVFKEIGNHRGIVGSSGSLWKEHRTFALSTMRDFGFGKRSLQGKIVEEVEVFLEVMKSKNGKAFDISDLLHTSISNVICSIALGEHFEHNDEKLKRLTEAVADILKNSTITGLLTFLPFLSRIPGDPVNYGRVKANVDNVIGSLQTIIDDHKTHFDGGDVTNYLDAYLKHQKEHANEQSTFTDDQLLWSIANLFGAGTDTTTTAMKWFILYMLHHPEVQQRMRQEIHDVIGNSRFPSLEDRINLPYTDAVLYETLRVGNITANSLPHGLTEDLEFRGHLIPKHAMLIPSLDSILNDPKIFEDPCLFKPERFMDDKGHLTGTEKVLTFGIGRRACLGESLAKMELFLFAASLIQRFQLLSPEGEAPPPTSQYVMGVTRAPLPYTFRAIECN